MAQNVLTIEYSDDLLKRLGIPREKFPTQAKFLLAAKLYELGHLSSGEAAAMAGLGRVDFLLNLHKIGIPMSNLQLEDLESDIDFALNG
jgi:predicted HTH domain antitoxin